MKTVAINYKVIKNIAVKTVALGLTLCLAFCIFFTGAGQGRFSAAAGLGGRGFGDDGVGSTAIIVPFLQELGGAGSFLF